MEKKRKIQLGIGLSIFFIIILIFFFNNSKDDTKLPYLVKKGNLTISVTTSGELEAKNSVPIMGPSNLNKLRIWQIKIDDLIEEGTIVKKGDYVAALSKSEVIDKLQEEESQLLKSESQEIQTRLDTTIELNQARNELKNLEYAVKEKEIILEQSIYEPPATIRQAQNDVEKAKKALADMTANYALKKKKAKAQMDEVLINLHQAKRKIKQIEEILDELIITAPENGMVIYQRDWEGTKYKIGSMIGTWSPTVATLPDLSQMVSKTYINEVDISKVKVGQEVQIALDAFPKMKLTGKVTDVSNIGQQNPNSDGKVFEVIISIQEKNSELRPAMTTSNTIIQEAINDVLLLPLEALHNQGDSIAYVYKKERFGISKQEVKIGKTNSDFCQIVKGLTESSEVYLSIPEKTEDLTINRL